MGAAAVPIAAALISTAGTVYASENAKGPSMPKAPVLPKLPDTKSVAANTGQAELAAKTAGGTILSDQRKNAQVSDGANGTRKVLLGL